MTDVLGGFGEVFGIWNVEFGSVVGDWVRLEMEVWVVGGVSTWFWCVG